MCSATVNELGAVAEDVLGATIDDLLPSRVDLALVYVSVAVHTEQE